MEKRVRQSRSVSTRFWNINSQDGRSGLLGQVAMVSETKQNMALKRGRRVNRFFLVSKAKTGGGYGKMKQSLQKVIGERKWPVFIVPILPGDGVKALFSG